MEIHYRVDYGSLSHILNTFYCLGFLAANGYVQWLIHRRGTVQAVVAVRTERPGPGGDLLQHVPLRRFQQPLLRGCTTSRWRYSPTCSPLPGWSCPGPPWWSAIYSALSFAVEPGLDLAGKEEQHLFYRLVALYAVSAAVSIVAGLERESRRRGLERERELQRQRIELSQTIHDTTAQWAYMIGLGVEGAMELADESQEALKAKLRLVAELSRSAMWELRHPIDGGQIFRGEELGEVLEAHAATFHRHKLGPGGAGAAWAGNPRCRSLTRACSSP